MARYKFRCAHCRVGTNQTRLAGKATDAINEARGDRNLPPIARNDRICFTCSVDFRVGRHRLVEVDVEPEVEAEVEAGAHGGIANIEDLGGDFVDDAGAHDGIANIEDLGGDFVDEAGAHDGIANIEDLGFVEHDDDDLERVFVENVEAVVEFEEFEDEFVVPNIEDQPIDNMDEEVLFPENLQEDDNHFDIDQYDIVMHAEDLIPVHPDDNRQNEAMEEEIGDNPQLVPVQRRRNCDTDSSTTTPDTTDSDPSSNDDVPEIHLNVEDRPIYVKAVPNTGSHCFICRNIRGRDRVPARVKMDLWLELRVFVPNEARICACHHTNGVINREQKQIVRRMNLPTTYPISSRDVAKLLESVSKLAMKPRVDFGQHGFSSDADYDVLVGLSRVDFDRLLSTISPHSKLKGRITTRTALAIFMMKLRTGCSQKVLATLFKEPQSRISSIQNTICVLLHRHFVPQHLGYGHVTREEYKQNWHTNRAERICGTADDQLIAILDGTYFYCQKSANYKLQRELYSVQKSRPLCKAMMVVSPNGRILAVESVYKANGRNNDANITKHLVQKEDGFMSFFRAGDYIIWDRGFRDCSNLAGLLGLNTRMPNFLGKRKQHTTEEANDSRLTTSVRWVVESANGRLKGKWRFLDGVIQNKYLNSINRYIEIGCALLNAFSPPLVVETPEQGAIVDGMLERAELSNLLQEAVENGTVAGTTVSQFHKMRANALLDFPQLSLNDIRGITFGVYQLKQAASYAAEHVDAEGNYELFYQKRRSNFPETESVIRVRLQSRHVGSVTHHAWIHYRREYEGRAAIGGWYCRCKAGARVVGCCAHVCAVLWYLGYARHLPEVHYPSANVGRNLLDAARRERSPIDAGDDQPIDDGNQLDAEHPVDDE